LLPQFSLSPVGYSANKGAELRPREGTFLRQASNRQQRLSKAIARPAVLKASLAAIAWMSVLAAPALALPCPRDPSLAAPDAALGETALSSPDAAAVRALRVAVQRSLTQDNRTAARRALFQAMAVMGWQYRQEPPRVRSTSVCPRGEWTRKD
jgi:hypothetical protein